jgi:hypothetical protein
MLQAADRLDQRPSPCHACRRDSINRSCVTYASARVNSHGAAVRVDDQPVVNDEVDRPVAVGRGVSLGLGRIDKYLQEEESRRQQKIF